MAKKYTKHKHHIYAMYKGEEFLCEGTREEICKQMNIKLATFQFYRTSHYKRERHTRGDNNRVIIRVDAEDKIYN